MPKEAKMCHDWLRKGINLVAYGFLSLLTGYLVIGVYKDYQEGRTDFFKTKVPLKRSDYPVILVEISIAAEDTPYITTTQIQYGNHFIIEVHDRNNNKIPVVYLDRGRPLNVTDQSLSTHESHIEIYSK